jgi:iron only hydrogenase large subunit-like protein
MSITLADVDDYISPAQACINPLFTDTKSTNNEGEKGEDAKGRSQSGTANPKRVVRRRRRNPLQLGEEVPSELQAEEDSTTVQKRPTLSYALDDDDLKLPVNSTVIADARVPEKKETKATVTVADCLACSGCITSAEAVLVTQHSVKRLVEKCSTSQDDRRVVFTISPAVIADLTRALALPLEGNDNDDGKNSSSARSIVFQKVASFLSEKFNAEVVIDGAIPQKISLLESAMEFCHRYRYVHGGNKRQKQLCDEEIPAAIDDRINLSTPSIALSATETRFLLRNQESSDQLEAVEVKHDGGGDSRLHFLHSGNAGSSLVIKDQHVLPMLASSCPGFVCYVEKTVVDAIPNLCTVKSPMAIAGSLIKHNVHKLTNPLTRYDLKDAIDLATRKDDDIIHKSTYHVSIMPCHDKKLEAERKDLAWETFNEQHEALVPDVDLVITTSELFTVLADAAATTVTGSENDGDFDAQLKRVQQYASSLPTSSSKMVTEVESGNAQDAAASTMKGSGSYADFIFRFASSELFGYSIPANEPLPWKKVGNNMKGSHNRRVRSRGKTSGGENAVADSSEVTLFRHSDDTYSCEQRVVGSDAVLKFATAYGFKNIQIMMSKVSTNEMKMNGYDYVESMACPSGCLNGGGQTHASDDTKRERPSEMRSRVEQTRSFMQDVTPWTEVGELTTDVCSTASKHLHTRFHVVPKLELSTGATAGVAIDDTMW